MKNLFDQVGDGRGQNWSLKVFPRSFFNECLAGAHPLPVEDSQPAQPQLHDCLHLLHQVSLLHPWLFVQEVFTPPSQVWEGAVQAWGSLVVRSLSSSPGKMLCLSRCRQGTLCLVSGEVKTHCLSYIQLSYIQLPKDKKTWACFAFGCASWWLWWSLVKALCKPGIIAIFRVVAMGAMFFVCSNGWRSRRVALLAVATNVSIINLS